MTGKRLHDLNEPLNAEATPHLSYSRIQKYLICPEQYRLYYVEKLRAKIENASLVFGSVMHLALAEYFRRQIDPARTFLQDWDALKSVNLRFSRKESWQKLRDIGQRLLEKFLREEAQKIGEVFSVEHMSKFGVSIVPQPFVSIIDLVAELEGKRTLIEFKTAAADFEEYEVALSDQLSVYAIAEPDLEQMAMCVFVKTKKPRISWHITRRTPEQVAEYIEKAALVADQIERRIFYKRVGKWCRQCEFLPMCLGDKNKAKDTLVRITWFVFTRAHIICGLFFYPPLPPPFWGIEIDKHHVRGYCSTRRLDFRSLMMSTAVKALGRQWRAKLAV